MKKIENLIFIFFMIMGVIFISIGILLTAFGINKENRVYIDATIKSIDSNDKVIVTYEVDDKKYTEPLDFYTSSYYEGKKIKVYYDRNNPSNVDVDESSMMMWIFVGMGILFFLIGLIPLLISLKKKNSRKKIRELGKEIIARYVDIVQNTMYTVNGKNPYNIICEWDNPSDGKTYRFKSENIWFDPYNVITNKHIEYFKVYIDPNNMKKYVVDISTLEDNVVDLT